MEKKEADYDRMIREMGNNTKIMKRIGLRARTLLEAIMENSENMVSQGDIDGMAARAIKLEKDRPEEYKRLCDEYTDAVKETMEGIAELYPTLQSMIAAFFRIPQDKQDLAARMN